MLVYAIYTGPYSHSVCEPHVHSTCTSCVLYTYVYALVGEVISIRDLYICANESHAVFHSENVAVGFKTSIDTYFVEKTALGYWSCLRLENYAITFEQNVFSKITFLKLFPYCEESFGTSLL